jgi:hypothetical protein
MLVKGVIVLYDIAFPPVFYNVQDMLIPCPARCWDISSGPNLSSYDFHVFDQLIKALKGCRSRLDLDKGMVMYWF